MVFYSLSGDNLKTIPKSFLVIGVEIIVQIAAFRKFKVRFGLVSIINSEINIEKANKFLSIKKLSGLSHITSLPTPICQGSQIILN